MIRKLLLLAALTAALRIAGLLPFKTTDVAGLKPVEALVVSMEDGRVTLSGGESRGQGTDWNTALQDLREGASGTLFLGTAEQVILCAEAADLLEQIARSEVLRPAAVVVYTGERSLDPEQAAEYLSAHDAGLTLQKVRASLLKQEPVALPVLKKTKGGLRLDGTLYR